MVLHAKYIEITKLSPGAEPRHLKYLTARGLGGTLETGGGVSCKLFFLISHIFVNL